MCVHKNKISWACKEQRMFMFTMEILPGYPYGCPVNVSVKYVWSK